MTVFQQAILKGALLPIHLANGIVLQELDDHILLLKYGDEIIAPFSATGAKVTEIREAATEWLILKNLTAKFTGLYDDVDKFFDTYERREINKNAQG